MRHSIEKLLFFFLLGIFLFSFPVYLNATKTDNSSLLTRQVSGKHLIELVSSEQDNQQTSTTIVFQSRWDIYEVLFGTHMVIIGLVAVALAL